MRIRTGRTAIFAAALLGVQISGALAASFSNPELSTYLKQLGYSVTELKVGQGTSSSLSVEDPKTKVGFGARAVNCNLPGECQGLVLTVTNTVAHPTLSLVNKMNRTVRNVKYVRDEEGLVTLLVEHLAHDGLSKESVKAAVDALFTGMAKFDEANATISVSAGSGPASGFASGATGPLVPSAYKLKVESSVVAEILNGDL